MKHLIVLVAVCLCGCAQSAEEKRQVESERYFATEDLKNCAIDNVSKIDDRTSDASTIAMALASRCHNEYRNSVMSFSNGMNYRQKQMLVWTAEQTSRKIDTFLPWVLKYRTSLKSPAPNASY
ncbi:hypothetical protein GOB93_14320 [Acetobacter musti]|uniref:Lipoprotein n=1 Tax=Acetobacter musti TaxID=864732 RepID=A0ABX0JQR5_9PROT|nr:hypothetical protein [Acetobacter musti]NHN85808.1 hypothetical protein [Acetobacter musti]